MVQSSALISFRVEHDMTRKELSDFLGLYRREDLLKEWELQSKRYRDRTG